MLLQISKCDRRLLSIKIPNNITRAPQSIHQLAKWKGEKKIMLRITYMCVCILLQDQNCKTGYCIILFQY